MNHDIAELFADQLNSPKRDVITYVLSKDPKIDHFQIISHPKSQLSSLQASLTDYKHMGSVGNTFPKFVRNK